MSTLDAAATDRYDVNMVAGVSAFAASAVHNGRNGSWSVCDGAVVSALIAPFRLGVTLFLVNSVLQVVSTAAEWLEAYGLTDQGPIEQFWPTMAAKTLVFPMVFTVLAMLVLLFTRLRPTIVSCLKDPSTIAIAVVFLVGLVLSAIPSTTMIGWILGWLAFVLAAITQLRLEDRGPQPWLGAGFIVFAYTMSLFTPIGAVAGTSGLAFSLPSSIVGWIGAVINLALAVLLFLRHVRKEGATLAMA